MFSEVTYRQLPATLIRGRHFKLTNLFAKKTKISRLNLLFRETFPAGLRPKRNEAKIRLLATIQKAEIQLLACKTLYPTDLRGLHKEQNLGLCVYVKHFQLIPSQEVLEF